MVHKSLSRAIFPFFTLVLLSVNTSYFLTSTYFLYASFLPTSISLPLSLFSPSLPPSLFFISPSLICLLFRSCVILKMFEARLKPLTLIYENSHFQVQVLLPSPPTTLSDQTLDLTLLFPNCLRKLFMNNRSIIKFIV